MVPKGKEENVSNRSLYYEKPVAPDEKSEVPVIPITVKAHKKKARIPHPKKLIVIWLGLFIGLFWTQFYAHYGADFTGVSLLQFIGFIFATIAGALQLLTGFVGVLHLGRNDNSSLLPLKLIVIMMIQLMCCISSIILFIGVDLPDKDQMKSFVITGNLRSFVTSLWLLEHEAHCCGVDSYKDYNYGKKGWIVPLSCCNYKHKMVNHTACAVKQNPGLIKPDHTHGCWSKNITKFEDFQQIAPNFYALMNFCRYLIVPLFVFSIIFTTVLILYYLIYKKQDKLREVISDETSIEKGKEPATTVISNASESIITSSYSASTATTTATVEMKDQNPAPSSQSPGAAGPSSAPIASSPDTNPQSQTQETSKTKNTSGSRPAGTKRQRKKHSIENDEESVLDKISTTR